MKILQGEGSPSQNAVVISNAAMALSLTDDFGDYQSARDAAKESLESGKAYATLKQLLALQA
jgi:anthranilate phosphoribosyltransferase